MADHGKQIRKIKERIVPVNQANPYAKVLVYGRNGHGKTRFAASGPRTLIIDVNEEGTQSVASYPDTDVLLVKKWEDLTYAYWMLRAGDHEYESVVIDTLTQAQHMCMKHILKEAEDRDPNRPPSMPRRQDWGQLGELMKPLIYDYRNLPLHVVFVCQERVDRGSDEDEDATNRKVPDLSPSVRGAAMSAVGVMGRVYQREVRTGRAVKGSKQRKETTEWMTLMLVGPHDDYETKDRTNLLGRIVKKPTMTQVIEAWQKSKITDEDDE